MIDTADYIPSAQRKTILLLSDDLRTPSGIGTQSHELVKATCHRYNWVQIAALQNHPDKGKMLNLSEDYSRITHITDASVILLPNDGYGDFVLMRQIIKGFKIDAIMIFTDPRYFKWLFMIEHELRQQLPILYWNIWDNPPYPMYNRAYYKSCDALFGISKQTVNINKQVLGDGNYVDMDANQPYEPGKPLIKYIPHGIPDDIFKPLRSDDKELEELKRTIFGDSVPQIIFMYNNRNIRRKMPQNLLEAFNKFVCRLPEDKRQSVALIMKTDPIDPNGTDLLAVYRDVVKDSRIVFVPDRISQYHMNLMYNICDVVVNIANAEGFGLATAEALMVGKPIIATVTGGLQDQMSFVDENGEKIKFDATFNTNSVGRYTSCSDWAFPVFPKINTLTGSPETPYIYDSYVSNDDVADVLYNVYSLGKDELARRGILARYWMLSSDSMMNTTDLSKNMIAGIDFVFENWKPRAPYTIVKF